MAEDDMHNVYDDMRAEGEDIPEWWGKPAPGANIEYTIYFATSDPNYPYAYALGYYSTKAEADKVCAEYKSGSKSYSINGKDGTETTLDKLNGTYQVKKQYDGYLK